MVFNLPVNVMLCCLEARRVLCLSFKLEQLNGLDFRLIKIYFEACNKNYVVNRSVCVLSMFLTQVL